MNMMGMWGRKRKCGKGCSGWLTWVCMGMGMKVGVAMQRSCKDEGNGFEAQSRVVRETWVWWCCSWVG